jgi:hypothetical protein
LTQAPEPEPSEAAWLHETACGTADEHAPALAETR